MHRIIPACLIATLLLCSNAFASNCTKEEVMKMVGAGYPKIEIDKICDAPSMCCCSYKKLNGGDWEARRLYKWMNSDDCTNMGKESWTDDPPEPYCTSQSSCGR